MFVEQLMSAARERLIVVGDDAPLVAAARRLRGGAVGLVVVCTRSGEMSGVVSKTDIVDRISECTGASCTIPVADVMSSPVSCRRGDPLREVWRIMTERRLKNIPVVDDAGHPIGILAARQILEALLGEVEEEENLLRDYVTCVGYR